jgi:hypothetical protein
MEAAGFSVLKLVFLAQRVRCLVKTVHWNLALHSTLSRRQLTLLSAKIPAFAVASDPQAILIQTLLELFFI